MVQFADVYGHDQRYNEALAGKSIEMIAARDPALALKKKNDELRDSIAAISPKPRRKVASTAGGTDQCLVWLGTMEEDCGILAAIHLPLVPIVLAGRSGNRERFLFGPSHLRESVRSTNNGQPA